MNILNNMYNTEMIKVVLVKPLEVPKIIEIPHTLKEMQKLVGGNIEAVYPWKDTAALICDEEALLKDYIPNRSVGNVVIYGTFFICGLAEENFASLTDEQAEKYSKMFAATEIFIAGKRYLI